MRSPGGRGCTNMDIRDIDFSHKMEVVCATRGSAHEGQWKLYYDNVLEEVRKCNIGGNLKKD